jgi:heme-degrading monooxygenase HmoA
MYAVSEIIRFTPGRRKEGIDRLSWMHRLMQQETGFREAVIAKYLGDATRFLVLRYWQDADSYAGFRAIFARDHAANRPVGLYEIESNQPFDCYYERQEAAGGDACFLVKTHRRVPEAAWEQYLPHQKEVEALTFELGGLAELRRLKAPESTDVLNVYRYRSRSDFERYFESSAHFELTTQWPEGIDLVSTQLYEVVSEARGQATSA